MAKHRELSVYGELLELVPVRDIPVKEGVSSTEQEQVRRKSKRYISLFALIVVLPTALAGLFFGLIAADRFEAEARFVIRNSGRSMNSALTNFLQSTGVARATDDAFAVAEYIMSRDAMVILADKYGLKEAFNRPEGDFLLRFPNFFSSPGAEGLYRHYLKMVSVKYDQTTGVVTLHVQAFRPGDAQQLTVGLMLAGEEFVNRLNSRAQHDAIALADAEVQRLQQRTILAQQRLTAFRNREALVDPAQASLVIVQSISRLSLEAAEANMQINELQRTSPQTPQLQHLRVRLGALEQQIMLERRRLAGDANSIASVISEYETLVLEREFSERALTMALGAVDLARVEAQRQQIYLERVSAPSSPDYPTYPYRFLWMFVVFLVCLVIYRVLLIMVLDVHRHADA